MNRRSDRSASSRAMRLCISTALAAGVLTGCTAAGVRPDKFASSAQTALAGGSAAKAVGLAEKAVEADPRNAAYRVLLGNSYLKAGRFESARQAYTEAMELGEDSSRTALSLALADIALGRYPDAIDTLNGYRDSLPAADYGLAMALAGQSSRGVAVLSDALRSGENTPKTRQNLALAYALDGRWREARVMASQDVPADQIDDRIQEWALMAQPELVRGRVAALLDVPLRGDAGQPAALALANFPAAQQLAAEAATRADQQQAAPEMARAAIAELPATDAPALPVPTFADASSTPAPSQMALIDVPASTPAPYSAAAYAPSAKPAAPSPRKVSTLKAGTHVVQLGAFSTAEGARRAWRHFASRNPSLNGYSNVTTQVTVNGRQFWRVQAAGFSGFASASSMCGSVKARGGVCLVLSSPRDAAPGMRAAETRMARKR